MEDLDIDEFLNLEFLIGGGVGNIVDFEKIEMFGVMGFGVLQVKKVFKEIGGDVECVVEWLFSYFDDQGFFDDDVIGGEFMLVVMKELVGSVELFVNF